MVDRGDTEQLCESRHVDEKGSNASMREWVHREGHCVLHTGTPESTLHESTYMLSQPISVVFDG